MARLQPGGAVGRRTRAADRRADPGPRRMSGANRDERNAWDARHRTNAAPGAPEPSVTEMLELLPRGVALDIAAGSGRHSLLLARAGFKVVAIDHAEASLRALQTTAPA